MADNKTVTVLYDERVLAHFPDTNSEFLPGRLDKPVRAILSGLNVQWKYPEHSGRLTAIMDLLAREPIPGVQVAWRAKSNPGTSGHGFIPTGFLDQIFGNAPIKAPGLGRKPPRLPLPGKRGKPAESNPRGPTLWPAFGTGAFRGGKPPRPALWP